MTSFTSLFWSLRTIVRVSPSNLNLYSYESVPVFDGTQESFDYVKNLSRPHQIWPRWDTAVEIKEGSCVVVAFTAGVYIDNGGQHNLSNNIQWLSVLGAA